MCHFNDLLLNAGFSGFIRVSELEKHVYMSDNGNAHAGSDYGRVDKLHRNYSADNEQ